MKHDGIWLPSSTGIIKYFDRELEAFETVAAVEGLEYLQEDVLAKWSVEYASEAKTWHHWILPGYNHVFRL